jgi:hypothetical protein
MKTIGWTYKAQPYDPLPDNYTLTEIYPGDTYWVSETQDTTFTRPELDSKPIGKMLEIGTIGASRSNIINAVFI